MHKYEIEWARFHDLNDDEEINVGKELRHTVWYAEHHEDLVKQLEEYIGKRIRYLAYHCTRNTNATDKSPNV